MSSTVDFVRQESEVVLFAALLAKKVLPVPFNVLLPVVVVDARAGNVFDVRRAASLNAHAPAAGIQQVRRNNQLDVVVAPAIDYGQANRLGRFPAAFEALDVCVDDFVALEPQVLPPSALRYPCLGDALDRFLIGENDAMPAR